MQGQDLYYLKTRVNNIVSQYARERIQVNNELQLSFGAGKCNAFLSSGAMIIMPVLIHFEVHF